MKGIEKPPDKGRKAHMTGEEMTISDTLEKIRQRSTSLSAKTDQLNATFASIEQQLLGSGVEFWWHTFPFGVRIAKGESGVERFSFVLGYAKFNEGWHLAAQCLVETLVDEYRDQWEPATEHGDPTPLTRVPRALRIAASEHIEPFLDALHEQLVAMEAKVDRANALVVGNDAALNARAEAETERILNLVERAKQSTKKQR